ncbi:MAG: Holliday junction resolvase RuvX [Elusimicrobia bacterium]|nr:Holliday junction resolvase RuvX [Elusimicrobiota bacterium]
MTQTEESRPQRILGIDYGAKRVGMALTDPLGITVQPLPFVPYKSDSQFLQDLKHVVLEKSVELIVVGVPKRADGSLGPEAERYLQIAKILEHECSLPVECVDESFTSRESEDFLIRVCGASRKRRKKVKDSLSACLILESYLNRIQH